MEYGKYFKVHPEKLEWILTELGKRGFSWREGVGGSPMEKHFKSAISHGGWTETHFPILEVEIYKHYKFLILKTNMMTHNEPKPILSYEELLKFVGLE